MLVNGPDIQDRIGPRLVEDPPELSDQQRRVLAWMRDVDDWIGSRGASEVSGRASLSGGRKLIVELLDMGLAEHNGRERAAKRWRITDAGKAAAEGLPSPEPPKPKKRKSTKTVSVAKVPKKPEALTPEVLMSFELMSDGTARMPLGDLARVLGAIAGGES